MKLEVTREVVTDLWPLYRSGEASSDSRTLVQAYLASDTEFASNLRESENIPRGIPGLRLSPDAERRLLDEARDRARKDLLIKGAAIAFAAVVVLSALAGVMLLTVRSLR
jgi:ferric-dicitrate binding protein FerR (iron transport regulator)